MGKKRKEKATKANHTEFTIKRNGCWYSRCGRRVEAWPRPLTSVVCHEMLFWCQSQPLWPLLPRHNTSSTPQPSVQLIHWASTRIPTIHFPWRLSSSPVSPSHPVTRSPFLSLCVSPPPVPSHGMIQNTAAHNSAAKISAGQYSRPKHFK